MGFFRSLFGKKPPSPDIVANMDLGKYFYLLDYTQHCADVLSDHPNQQRAILELFVFRAWTTHFCFQIFSAHKEVSEKITYEVWNLANTLGRVMLNLQYKIKIPDYLSFAESRWHEYDRVLRQHHNAQNQFAAPQLGQKIAEFCGFRDPVKTVWFTMDFLKQMGAIQDETINLRISSHE